MRALIARLARAQARTPSELDRFSMKAEQFRENLSSSEGVRACARANRAKNEGRKDAQCNGIKKMKDNGPS